MLAKLSQDEMMELIRVAKINPKVMPKWSMLLDDECSRPRRKVIEVNLSVFPKPSSASKVRLAIYVGFVH